MKENLDNIKEYSIKELNTLIDLIKSGENLTEEGIAAQMGYNTGYISQVRSRGSVSAKFMEALKREFRGALQNARNEIVHRQGEIRELSSAQILTVLANAIDKQAEAYNNQAKALADQAEGFKAQAAAFAAQAEIMKGIAQQADQLTIKEKVQTTEARTKEIEANLGDVRRDVTTLLERQELAIEEFRDQFLIVTGGKTDASGDADKTQDQNDGNG